MPSWLPKFASQHLYLELEPGHSYNSSLEKELSTVMDAPLEIDTWVLGAVLGRAGNPSNSQKTFVQIS